MSVPFTQTKEYLKWHEAVGTETFYLEFNISDDGRDFNLEEEKEYVTIGFASCIILNLKFGKVLYVPYGPYFFTEPTEKEKNKVVKIIRDLAKKEKCVFARIEDQKKIFKKSKYLVKPPKKTFASEGIFQPRMEWWLDINENEENVYERIHKDHKYSIRRAEREGVEVLIVRENLDEYFSYFWELLNQTSVRDGFKLYEKKYYEQIFKNKQQELKKFLVLTKVNGEFTSTALVVISQEIANLVFAGSVGERRELGFNHLMQWEAIKESKRHKCKIYNFGGIHEKGYGKGTLAGVTSFKKKFGGYTRFHGNFYDIPVKKLQYLAYLTYKMLK